MKIENDIIHVKLFFIGMAKHSPLMTLAAPVTLLLFLVIVIILCDFS